MSQFSQRQSGHVQQPTVPPMPYGQSATILPQNVTEDMPVVLVEDRTPPAKHDTAGGFLRLNVDKTSMRKLVFATIGFLIFFCIISFLILHSNNSKTRNFMKSSISEDITTGTNSVANKLNGHINWMTNAVMTSDNHAQTVNMIVRGNDVSGVAIIGPQSEILAGTNNAEPLTKLNLSGFPQSGVMITSLIATNGQVSPIIVQNNGESFLIVALTPGSLVNNTQANFALLESSGRVIDGPAELGKAGAATYYNMPADRLGNFIRSDAGTIRSHAIGDQDVWLTSQTIPGSSLHLIHAPTRIKANTWDKIAPLLGLLFLGTCLMAYTLMRNMFQQLKVAEENNTASEVSQQRYRAAVDGSLGGVWEIDLGQNEAYISPSLSELLGLGDYEQTISVPDFLNMFHAADRERLLHLVRRAHISGTFDIDLNVARLPLTLSCRGKPSTRGVDNARVVIGMAMDVTEQRGSQARLQAAEARLFDALRAMNDSFVIWNQRNQITLWNNRFEDFFGFTPGTLSKGLDHATVDYASRDAIAQRYDIGEGQYEVLLKDGRWIRYLENPTADGGRVSIGTDITVIRTREHQLQENETALQKTINVLRQSQTRIVELAESYEQEKIRAEQASQSKSEFLANMSHELRTPLNAINGFSDIMQKEMFGPLGDPRYKEYINDILFSGQHLLSLINDILDMSKIEAGKMNLNVETLFMNDMIQQVIRIVRGRADDNRLKLIYEEAETPEIEADPRAIKQILLNLITNAIKFTPEGGSVTVDVNVKKSGLIISVTDTGIGISKEDIDRLAKPFEQVDSQHARQHEGTGLGLALSKSLVELHGGNFKMASVVGEGTTVTFTLPNKPLKTIMEVEETEVADEISRLAQDIADVLSGGTEPETVNPALAPQPATIPAPAAIPAPAPMHQPAAAVMAPNPYQQSAEAAPAIAPPMPAQVQQPQAPTQAPVQAPTQAPNNIAGTIPPNPYAA